jgi:hypothetical protein
MFIRRNFSKTELNQSTTPNEYVYKSTDNIATILTADYFNELYDVLLVGDLIRVHCSNALTFIQVSAVTGKVVTVIDGVNLV